MSEAPRWFLNADGPSKPEPANDAARIFDLELEVISLKSALQTAANDKIVAERRLEAWIETWRAELRSTKHG